MLRDPAAVPTATMLTTRVNWKLQERNGGILTLHRMPSTVHNGWHNTCFKNICGMNETILEMVKKLPCKEPNTL